MLKAWLAQAGVVAKCTIASATETNLYILITFEELLNKLVHVMHSRMRVTHQPAVMHRTHLAARPKQTGCPAT
jgi:hypothetical protein